MTKNKVISEISLVLVQVNIFLVPANIFFRKNALSKFNISLNHVIGGL